ncbi:hypothetical protein [Helicobacter marmotae]|uniref:hypothetical protein n=1 Tax=Helicobacter marmotae TaxID=152490 RepID=UPI0011C03EC4|nr:hypothetical protein [Helicobacter marmotae]
MTDNSTLVILRPLSGVRDDNKTHVHRESKEFLLESPTTPLVCHVRQSRRIALQITRNAFRFFFYKAEGLSRVL